MKNILKRLKEVYDDFGREYLQNLNITCGNCYICCSAPTNYPKLSNLEYDFLVDFVKENNIEPSGEALKGYMEAKDRKICPYYDKEKGCIIYSARPFCCRVYGPFRFEKDHPLPETCAFRGKQTDVLDLDKYVQIKYLSEFMELRYRYAILAARDEKEKMEGLINLGEEYIRQNRPDDAFPVFEMSEKIEPSDSRPYFNLGCIYRTRGDMKRAGEKMWESCKLGGDKYFPYIYQNLGFIYLNMNLVDEAEKAFRKAIELEPGEAIPCLGMAFVNLARGEKEKAIENSNKAIKIEPDNTIAKSLVMYLEKEAKEF
jgi:Flp pilus assembly protein TadD